MSRRHILAVLILISACGGDSDESSGPCFGRGWLNTCHFNLSCQRGRYDLLCAETNDSEINQALDAAGIALDGSNCACVFQPESAGTASAVEVPYDNSFCSDQFSDDDADRHDKAAMIAADICDWNVDLE